MLIHCSLCTEDIYSHLCGVCTSYIQGRFDAGALMQVRHMCSAHFLVETCQTELALGHLLRHISRMKLGYRWGEIQVCESEIISLGLSVVMN